jgi:hypothetical protein
LNVNFEAMEEKYLEILRHYVNPNDCKTVIQMLLNLHSVSESKDYVEIDNATIEEAYYYDKDFNYWLVAGDADILIKKEDVEGIRYSR